MCVMLQLHHSDDSSLKCLVDSDPWSQKRLWNTLLFDRYSLCRTGQHTHKHTPTYWSGCQSWVRRKMFGMYCHAPVCLSKALWVQEANQQKWMAQYTLSCCTTLDKTLLLLLFFFFYYFTFCDTVGKNRTNAKLQHPLMKYSFHKQCFYSGNIKLKMLF